MCNEAVEKIPWLLHHVPFRFRTQEMCEKAVENHYPIRFIPDQYKTRWMSERDVDRSQWQLEYVPNHLKIQGMNNEAVGREPISLAYVPDYLKTKEMCKRDVEKYPFNLIFVPDYLKTQGMCDNAVRRRLWSLEYVPDWFVKQQYIGAWGGNDDYCDDDNDELFEWYDGYKKRKAQKASIKKELMPITWHPSRWWDWYMAGDEKKETEKLWS